MKSITKITFTFLTCLLVFSSCCEKQNADKPKKVTITHERATQLQENYISTRANFLNAYLDSINYFEKDKKKGLAANGKENQIVEDVRDVTFDLETLKQYIAYVEKEAKKQGLKGLGLRVYLGAYPKNDNSVKDPGFTTMFFMPTHQKTQETKNANNFFYWNEDEIIEGVDGLNLGHGGNPPNLNNLK